MNIKQTAAFIFAGIICMIGGAHAQTVITIGTSAKADHPFSAMDSLLTEITNGNLKGDITLALENGDYTMTKNFILNTAKFTGNDRLTITSKTGMRDSVRLHTSLSGAGAFQLTNARQVTVRNLTIESASNYNCFCFTSACAHVEIRNCVLLTPHNITNAKNSSIGNNATGFTLNDIRIVGNRIAGSQSNIKLTGSSTQRFHNIVVDSNDCSQAYDRGISIEFTDTLRIAHNTIRPRPYCSSSHYGLYASNNNAAEIIGNHLNMTGTTTYISNGTAMLCTVADTNRGSEPTLIANNIIIGNNSNEKNTVSTNYALYVFGNLRIVHNTIYQAGNGAGCLCGNGYLMNFDIRGNQLVCSKYNQYPMRLVPASQNYKYWKGKTVTDYNNYYSQFGIVACIGDDDIQSVSELQEVTKGDLHSLCLPVSWTTEMQPQDIAPFLMPNIGLAEDANGRLRGTVTAMGAHTPLRTDAALTGFGPTVIANGSCTIYALLVNNGIDTLKQLDIHWTYNETTQPPFRWNGSLPIGAADTIRLGSISAVGGKSTRLAAWVVSPNGSTDMNPANDTARLLQFICNGPMSGTYKVGQSGSTDFKEMGEALLALNQCGVNGAVTLELQSCTYRQLNISDSISGSSSRHPITIKAAANAQVVIDNDTAGASLVVENAQHWVFDNLTIGNCTNGLVGVRLTGDNRDITFIRCRIYSSCTATGTDYRCVENVNTENSYKMLSDIHFEENEIRGGCYNFYFSYGASTLGQLSGSSIYIDRNRMSEAYSCCISALRNNHFKSISGNLFQCRKNTKSFYAIYARYYSIWEEIVGNRFHLTAPEGSVYAIQMGEFTQYGYTTPGIFANNEMIIRTERGCYALHALGATDGGWEIHHNTFLLNSTILSPNGVYLSNSNEKVPFNFTRNIVVVTDTVHNSIALSFVKGDRKYGLREYNNLYSTGNVASLGNSSTKYKTISDLQAVSGQDANSISVMPLFADSMDLRLKDSLRHLCPIGSIPTDINGQQRTSWTTMGCHHAAMNPGSSSQDAALTGFLPLQATDPGTYPVSVILCNNDTAPIRLAEITCSVNGQTAGVQYFPQTPLAGHATDTVTVGRFNFTSGRNTMTARVRMTGDLQPANDTIRGYHDISECDLQIRDISASSPAPAGSDIAPAVRIANSSNIAVRNVVLHVDVIDQSKVKTDALTDTISTMAANETRNYVFSKGYKVPDYAGSYTLKAYVEAYPKDERRSNDTLSKLFKCYKENDSTGIREALPAGWELGQNRPNPARSETCIPCRLPQGAQAEFTVYSTNGQILYRKRVDAETTEIRLPLDGWASGTYYYCLECQGVRLTRKMTIQR